MHHLNLFNLDARGDTIYASTSDGIYRRHAFSPDDDWLPYGLQGKTVSMIAFLEDGRTLAHVWSAQPNISSLYLKDGSSFELFASHNTEYFGGPNFRMMATTVSLDTIIDLSANRRSFDGGNSWEEIFDTMSIFRFVLLDHQEAGRTWIGGESMIFQPILLLSHDYGQQFDWLPLQYQFFAGDNCTHWMIWDEDSWYVAGEGIIGRSDDQGASWETLLNTWEVPEQALYFYDIAFSPADSNFIYTSGDSNNPDVGARLNLIYSPDRGKSWLHEYHSFPGDIAYPVTSILVLTHKGNDIIFFGANGVYAYERSTTDLPRPGPGDTSMKLFPNPASDFVQISMENLPAEGAILSIVDLHGRAVLQKKLAAGASATKEVGLDLHGLSPGLYLCQLQGRNLTLGHKLLIR